VNLSIFSNLIFQTYTLARGKKPLSKFCLRCSRLNCIDGSETSHRVAEDNPFLWFLWPSRQAIRQSRWRAFPPLDLHNHRSSFIQPKARFAQFVSGIYLYGYQLIMGQSHLCFAPDIDLVRADWIAVFLGVGILRLRKCMRKTYPSWDFLYLKIKGLRYLFVLIFVVSNLFTIVLTARTNEPGKIPRWYWPIALGGLIAFSLLYWSALRCLGYQTRSGGKSLGSAIGLKLDIYQQGDSDIPEEMQFLMFEARAAGFRRGLKNTVRGRLWTFLISMDPKCLTLAFTGIRTVRGFAQWL